ncbi:MAG: hypothetical protein BWY71_01661 [Planctomycetes bacterium ADurb.Bin412]|nr:MAG: hypothetical protein BWY71_01661 [Planctomycetes bacterium ADurb.Bin412]
MDVHEAIAFDVGIAAQIQAFIAAAGKGIVENLQDRTRQDRAGKINDIVMAVGGAE